LKKWDIAEQNATSLLKEKAVTADDKMIAEMILGKLSQLRNAYLEAIQHYRNVVALNKAALAAEARYEIAACYWAQDDSKNAEKAAFETINKSGSYDYWIFKIDSVGNKLWDKRFGGPLYDACNGFVQMPDTSIFLYGSANQGISPVKTDSGVGGANDIWIVHFKYIDTTSTVGFMDPIAFDASISLYPNPASDVVTIASNKTQIQNITMYNLLGELIESKNYTSSHTIQFDLQTYPKGVYIAKITGKQSTVARKVLKN
jgi:tetratricopeptide (TPR) repeat protein